ncbi:MAG: F0F1 ATP synthase subunit B [Lachnospiraceae bacterium]|nr:F0F1 ATP synthase subunit B [Lachnospiraceae bacterium]
MLRLDINLVFTIINLIVLFVLMRIFLFKPVNNIIAKREEAIRKQFDDADAAKKEAEDLKTEYEASLAGAKDESARLITEAKEKARGEYDRIVKSADEEVNKKIQKAQETIEEEKQKTMRNMQSEIQELVVAAATKVVGSQVQADDSSRLYDDFIAEMGETK